MIKSTACIVLYNNSIEEIQKLLKSLNRYKVLEKIFIIDNSPSDKLSSVFHFDYIEYHHTPANPGFGASHNLGISLAKKRDSKFHFIINPDVWFEEDVISSIVRFLSDQVDVAIVMPKILNEDGSIQYLPKLLPSPWDMIWRKIQKPKKYYDRFIEKYELRKYMDNDILNVPIISGCFCALNLHFINEEKVYDENYFMYFEDWDFSRRMHLEHRTIYFPRVSIYHKYRSEANVNPKLFKYFIKSFVYYFSKWGWIFDTDRVKINKGVLYQLSK